METDNETQETKKDEDDSEKTLEAYSEVASNILKIVRENAKKDRQGEKERE